MSRQERTRRLIYAQRMVSALEDAIIAAAGGPVSVTFDGVTTRWDHTNAADELVRWRKQVDRYRRRNSRFSTIRMDGGR